MRWAKRDAETFLTKHPLPREPIPAPDPAPYLAALAAATTTAHASAITQHLLDAAQPALHAVSDILAAIARWDDRHRNAEPGTPPKMLMEAASRSLSVLGLADAADLALLRAEYDPAPPPPPPAKKRAASNLPPTPPSTPPAGPAPGR
ncbi:hypothetical protein OG288_37155 [Streptomyces tauricus]|uniref:Uncharacterized protein n=1 Tax=Streptomyces tauricus TaxID=68274 RepID=A0ABZ1JUR1_9ACTN|nr:hypothetical protein [Streptomyces tauricus]